MRRSRISSCISLGEIAGLASLPGGTLQVVSGAVILTSQSFDGAALPRVGAIALFALLALAIALLTLRGIARGTPADDDAALASRTS